MRFWKKLLFIYTVSCTTMTSAEGSVVVRQPHINVSLLSNVDQITPDQAILLGLYLQPDPGWHVYWQNPGDSGMAPALRWNSIEGIHIGDIMWPVPKKIPVQHLINYGYKGDVLLPVPVTLDQQPDGGELHFQARANWLVCKETCIPGKARLTLSLPVGKHPPNAPAAKQAMFQKALDNVPAKLDFQGAQVQLSGNDVSIQLYAKSRLFRQATTVSFFPITENLVEYSQPAKIKWHNNVLQITQTKSSSFIQLPTLVEGIIVIDDKQAWQFATRIQ